jgi:amidase
VAVGAHEADVALGSDTGGSVRIPAACCGVAGLKTTFGRISTQGVWPLAPSLDTIGPLARDVAGLVVGMQLLEPGFTTTAFPAGATQVARLRLPAAGQVDAGLGDDVRARLLAGAAVTGNQVAAARRTREAWRRELAEVFDRVGPVVIPTLADDPPTLSDAARTGTIRYTLPVNLAGLPALTLPVPPRANPAGGGGTLPVGLQLIGPADGEAALLAIGMTIEAAVRS